MIPPKPFDIFPPDWGMLGRSTCVSSDFSLNSDFATILAALQPLEIIVVRTQRHIYIYIYIYMLVLID